MQIEDVKKIIQELFRANMRSYPECYTWNARMKMPSLNAFLRAKQKAREYWKFREPDEVRRDTKLKIGMATYHAWLNDELIRYLRELHLSTENNAL